MPRLLQRVFGERTRCRDNRRFSFPPNILPIFILSHVSSFVVTAPCCSVCSVRWRRVLEQEDLGFLYACWLTEHDAILVLRVALKDYKETVSPHHSSTLLACEALF